MMDDIKKAQAGSGLLDENIKVAVRLRPTEHTYEKALGKEGGDSCVGLALGGGARHLTEDM
jgi:hypothetical protein